jgi:hypothetical protein
MANTTVSFTSDEGENLANLNWLPLAVGDTIRFADTSSNNPTVLFFSPDLINILTPAPPAHLILGQSGDSVLTVAAAQPGAYTIIVGSSPDFPPFFPERSSTNLFFESMPPMVGAPSPVDPPPRSGN